MQPWHRQWLEKPEITEKQRKDAKVVFHRHKQKYDVGLADIDIKVILSRKYRAEVWQRRYDDWSFQSVERGNNLPWPEIDKSGFVYKNGEIWEDKESGTPMSTFRWEDYVADAKVTNKKKAWVEDSDHEQQLDEFYAEQRKKKKQPLVRLIIHNGIDGKKVVIVDDRLVLRNIYSLDEPATFTIIEDEDNSFTLKGIPKGETFKFTITNNGTRSFLAWAYEPETQFDDAGDYIGTLLLKKPPVTYVGIAGGRMTKETKPQLQVVFLNIPGHERENVKEAIVDLKLFMNGELESSVFLDGDSKHSLNVLMWALRHGNHSFTIHAARAQIANISSFLKNLRYSMTAFQYARGNRKELQEVYEELDAISLQAGSFADDLDDDDDHCISGKYLAFLECRIADLKERKAFLECSHERGKNLDIDKAEMQWDDYIEKIADRFEVTSKKDDPDTYVSWRGKKNLREGYTAEQVRAQEKHYLRSALYNLKGMKDRTKDNLRNQQNYMEEFEDPFKKGISERREPMKSYRGIEPTAEDQAWHRPPNLTWTEINKHTEKSIVAPWSQEARQRAQTNHADGRRIRVDPEEVHRHKRERKARMRYNKKRYRDNEW